MTGVAVSVLIATHNRAKLLASTVRSLFQQDFPPREWELVVCIDGGSDGTTAMLREMEGPCRLVVLEQSHRGQAAARNAALSKASGELVLLLDDDILCPPNLLRLHWQAHRKGPVKVVLGALQARPGKVGLGSAWDRLVCSEFLSALRNRDFPRFPWVCANSSMPRATLRQHGGFDPSFRRSMEDLELGLRLWQAGVPCEYLPEALAVHLHEKTGSAVALEARWSGWHEVEVCRKHPWYRPFSQLAKLGNRSLPARKAWKVAMQVPGLELFTRLLLPSAERLPWLPGGEAAGMFVLRKLRGLFHFRGAAEACGSPQALFERFGVQLPVLRYQNVMQDPQRMPSSISPRDFERQLRWLVHCGFQTIRPADWLAWVRGGMPLPPRPVLLTFDHAYADLGSHALPLLRRYDCTATVFVVTGQVGSTRLWDTGQGQAERRLMSADEIQFWAKEGIDFGAYSRTHRDLCRLGDAELEEEVGGSAFDLRDSMGLASCSFVYPYGSADDRVRACVDRHFDVAFGMLDGLNGLATSLLDLRRTRADDADCWRTLQARLCLGRQ